MAATQETTKHENPGAERKPAKDRKPTDFTPAELSLLLFLESCVVDRGGFVRTSSIDAQDLATAAAWNAEGFVLFGRLQTRDFEGTGLARSMHWVRLTGPAFVVAAAGRRARAERSEAPMVKSYPRREPLEPTGPQELGV
jgi:hypothetical protein